MRLAYCIAQVLDLEGFKPFFLHGKVPAGRREPTVARFRSEPGFAVLVLSGVGITGLNLDCASVLVIVVRTVKLFSCIREGLICGMSGRSLVGTRGRPAAGATAAPAAVEAAHDLPAGWYGYRRRHPQPDQLAEGKNDACVYPPWQGSP